MSRWQDQRVNLAAPDFAVKPTPPVYLDVVYLKLRHLLSGPPEALKTLVALIILLEAIRSGTIVAIIDLEVGPAGTRRLLEDLGATPDELASIFYVEPPAPPTEEDIDALVDAAVGLVLIDAAAGAYGISGLDDMKRADAETFGRAWIQPLYEREIASLLIDHVTKSAESRGRFAIGSERKLGQADVHLGLEVVRPLSRGGDGLVRVAVHKDRPGYLRRPVVAEIALHSDPETHRITWEITDPGEAADGWKPTELMARVTSFLAEQVEPVSRSTVERAVRGKATYVRQAIDELVAAGEVEEEIGPNRARLLSLVTASSSLVPSPSPVRPDEPAASPSSVPPSRGDGDGRSDGGSTNGSSPSRSETSPTDRESPDGDRLTLEESAVIARHPELFPDGTSLAQIRDFLPSVLQAEAAAA